MSDFDDWLNSVSIEDDSSMREYLPLHFMEKAYEAGHKNGRESMKADILAMVNSCLVRDPTLQILAKQIEDMQ